MMLRCQLSMPSRGPGVMIFYWLKIFTRHDNPTCKLISKEIGYAALTSNMQQTDFDSMFRKFKATKAIIFDMRWLGCMTVKSAGFT